MKKKNKLLLSMLITIFATICFFNYASKVEAVDYCEVIFRSDVNDITWHIANCGPDRPRPLRYHKPELPTVSKTGYKFNGWYTASSGGTKVTINREVYKPHTVFYGQWTANKYTIRFNGYKATSGSMALQQMTYGTAATLKANAFTRTGYTFKNWNTKADGTGTSYANRASVKNLTSNNNGTVTLHTQWNENQYTLILNTNGGKQGNQSKVLKYETSSYNLGNFQPTKTGYTLKGWDQSKAATNPKYGKTSIVTKLTPNNNGTVTLFAIWTANKYTIKYNGNGATSGTVATQSMTYGADPVALNANNFKRTEYDFKGWNTKADGKGTNYTNKQKVNNLTATANGSVTLYAQWQKSEAYKITYDLDGGGLTDFNRTSYSSTSTTFTLNNPTKEGYEFIGWTGSNGTTPQMQVTIPAGSTGDKEYKANYKANTYEIEFLDADGGTKKLELEYGSELTDVPKSSKKGYTFVAWVDEEGNILGDTVQVGNKKYSPAFRANKYKISFDSNGGKGSMKEQQFTYDQSNKLQKNSFSKEKNTFKGWNTKEDGTGTAYSDESEISNLTDKDNDGIVLYAMWDAEAASPKAKNPNTGAYISAGIISLLLLLGITSYIVSKKKTNIHRI